MRSARAVLAVCLASRLALAAPAEPSVAEDARDGTAPEQRRRPGLLLEAYLGAPLNLPLPAKVRQSGEPDLALTPSWETRPFDAPLYYWLRAGWADAAGGWRVEFLHHKLYLADPPPEIQHLEVTHGYNLFSVSRLWLWGGGWGAHVGGGLVVGVPHSTVRGRTRPVGGGFFDTGYVPAGVAAQGGIGWRQRLWRGLFLSGEAAGTLAWARVPIAGGDADVPNAAVHLLAGLGYHF